MELDTYSLKNSSKEEVNTESLQAAPVPEKYSRWELLLPVLAILSLLIACIIISPKKYFWNDELYSYYFTSDPSFSGMLAAFHDKINNTPVLYFALGWVWDKAFGSSELSLRLFSSLSMGLALLVTWITVRRQYSFWATSIGILGVFCTSQIILLQNAEARMYGLFLALCALGLYFYDHFNRNQKPSNRMLFLNLLVHAGIVHTHLFGGFYSGAILLALFLSDRYYSRFRPKVYLSVILSWLTILFYLPSFFIQADAGKPRTWIPVPSVTDLLDLLNILAPSFFQLGFVVLLLAVAGLHMYRKEAMTDRSTTAGAEKNLNTEVPLLILAALFILMPVFIWGFSRTIKPIFYDRYMIPSALGWVIFLAYFASRTTDSQKILEFSSATKSWAKKGSAVMMLIVAGALIYYPVHEARKLPKQTPPDAFATDGYDDLPLVVSFSHIFLQTQHYSPQRKKFFFILDWEAAVDENSGLFSPQEYKHLDAIRRNYPERFGNNILTSDEFLSRFDRFLVADYPDYTRKCPAEPRGMATARAWIDVHCPQWVEMRLLNNARYKVTYLNNSYWYTMLLVEKQK
ncbi:glycosyltransferase family 39 protein [Pontibacter ruber]|uniref:Glycosyltransferase family 39 protein n=1 Tax=Pontibacter ruber TaxID=1343895 RepID=A0ABW5D0T7_9BACT|nr:glycosyltransferase family 39 protein [Pontibacter ruber]